MKLAPGNKAIHFQVIDVHGREINLEAYKGKKVLLTFFRNTACPYCNLRVHQMMRYYDQLKDNLEMLFFFESKKEIILRSSFHAGINPVPVISDHDKVIYQQYGIGTSLAGMLASLVSWDRNYVKTTRAAKAAGVPFGKAAADPEATDSLMPADFLIDENQMIHTAHYGNDMGDHLDIDKIFEFAGLSRLETTASAK
jgi:peroxiredoxin